MATKENNSNALSEDSPLKKRLRSRKEGAGLEVMGSQLAKEKSGCRPLAEVKEKRLEVLKANTAAFNCTEKYYTESQKKIEVFMGEDRPDSKENAVKPSAAPEEAAGNEEIVGKARPRSNLRTSAALAAPPPSHHENAPDLLKPTPELIEKLLSEETDERYHYLARNGTVEYVEPTTHTLFVELPQIPNVTIAYRRPTERARAKKAFDLSKRLLGAVPLLEGEELLEELDLGRNMITRMENLVSLPKLLSLSLPYNKISQMANMNTLQGLKFLDLSHNCIMQMDGMTYLKSLEELNLQSNMISKIAGLSHLVRLRVLKLDENMIDSLDGAESAVALRELHVSDLGRVQTLPRLEILDVSHNCLKTISKECAPKLRELRVDHNPCESDPAVAKTLQKIAARGCRPSGAETKGENPKPTVSPFKNLADALNYAKTVESSHPDVEVKAGAKDPPRDVPGEYTTEQKEQIERVKEEWKQEEERISRGAKSSGAKTEKPFLAVLQKDNVLHLWGAGALDSLTAPEYEANVSEIVFEFIKFEHIVYPPVLQELRKYKNLAAVSLSGNCLSSFVLLSKLEVLDRIRRLTVTRNPVCRLATLQSFVTYRFQHLTEFNGKVIGPEAKKIAKQQFERFDRSLAAATLANKKHVSYKRLGCSKAAIKCIAKENEVAAANRAQKAVMEGETVARMRKAAMGEAEETVTTFVYSYVGKLEDGSAYTEEGLY